MDDDQRFYVAELTGLHRFKKYGTVWGVLFRGSEDLIIGCLSESEAYDVCHQLNHLWDYREYYDER